jgi:transport protein
MNTLQTRRQPSFIAQWIRRLSIPIVLGWLALLFLLSTLVPPLEEVAAQNQVSMSPSNAPSMQAMANMGRLFQESDSDAIAMLILEGDEPLGEAAHDYYDGLIDKLRADSKHIQHVQDFWGDPLTEAGAQSNDGKAAYVQLNLAGNMGETLSNESVEAVRTIVADSPPPPGVRVFVSGPAALQADMTHAGDSTIMKITIVTFVVIITMLLFFYRSVVTVILLLLMVGVQLTAARAVVAVLGYHHIIGLSTFAVNMLVSLTIAAGTDYAIFLIGRYQEARSSGATREEAYYEMFHGTAHVVLGSGLTIAGATYCLTFTRMPYFQTLGVPCAVGILAGVAVALTLGPAVITIGSRFGLFEPKRSMRIRFWRRIGTTIVRWPGPVLTASLALALIGLAALPGYKANYDDTKFIPKDIPANLGFDAANRHFSMARMNPEVLLIEADHDLRNSSDFLVLDKVAKAVFRVPGIARVQAITRPSGTPIEHTSLPFLMSLQGAGQLQNMKLMKDRMADMKTQADEMGKTLATMRRMYELMTQLTGITHDMVGQMNELQGTIHELRDNIANFDDFFRPIRNYFYWEPHCYNIPICWSIRSIFDTLDGVSRMTDTMDILIVNMHQLDALMPQMLAQFGPMITTMESMQRMMLTTHRTEQGLDVDGQGVRRSQERRLLLPSTGSLRQPGLSARHEELLLAGRQGGKDDHRASRGSGYARRPFARRTDQDRGNRSGEGHAAGGREDLAGRNGGDVQGHGGRLEIRPADRRNRIDLPDLFDHALDHQKPRCRLGDRRHRGAFSRCVVRTLGARLATHPRHRTALDGSCDGGHHPAGRRIGLQPVVGVAVQGGNTRRVEDGNHPRDGRHRQCRDGGRSRVRSDHVRDGGQRSARHRPDGHHDRARAAVRHAGSAVVHDPRNRHSARPVVLVADERANPSAEAEAGSGRGRRWLNPVLGRYPAVNWVFSDKRPGQNPESRQKTAGDAQRDER